MEKGFFDAVKASRFDNEGRLNELRPYELLNEYGSIRCGMTCIDLGSGTGTFAIPMADCVGSDGIVYAVDNDETMAAHIQTRAPSANIITLVADASSTGLERGIADICLMAFILHEVAHPQEVVTEAFRLLKPGGRTVVVEWRAEIEGKGPPKSARLDRDRIEALFSHTGLVPVSYVNWSVNHCIAVAIK